MILATLVLAAVAPLHVSVTFQTAEVRSGSEVLARVLVTSTNGVDETVLSKEQKQEYAEVLRRIDATWANEDRRGRLRLSLALSKIVDTSPRAGQTLMACRFLLPEDRLVRVDWLYAAATSSTVFVVEDLESGQYFAVIRTGTATGLAGLFGELFRAEDGQAKLEAIRRANEEARRVEANSRVVVEVGGQIELLETGAEYAQIGPTLRRLWDNLDGEPRKRLELVLALLKRAETVSRDSSAGDSPFVGLDAVAAGVPEGGPPIATLPAGVTFVATSSFGDGLMGLQAPPEAVTKPFYRAPGWRPFDFTLSFPAQVRRVLCGDRK